MRILRGGGAPEYPDAPMHLIAALDEMAWWTGAEAFSAADVAAWSAVTEWPLGPIDVQHASEASRAFVQARAAYDGAERDPPWSPPLDDEGEARLAAAQDRLWAMAMGSNT